MYSLFNDRLPSNKGSVTFPEYTYIRRQLHANLETVISYHRKQAFAVPSQHLLVTVLQSLNVSLALDVNIYRGHVEDVAEDLARILGLTSSLSPGKPFKVGPLYGHGSQEVWIAETTPFTDQQVLNDWENLQPIRFLSHPKTDLGLNVPMGIPTSSEAGVTVVLVDIPMLACQYKMWRAREAQYNPNNQRSVMQFIAGYPLPNALFSQYDTAIFNRLMHLSEGLPVSNEFLKHPFFLGDFSKQVDNCLKDILLDTASRGQTFDMYLAAIPLVSYHSARDLIALPRMPKTQQVTWALALARIPVVRYLLNWAFLTKNEANRHYKNVIRRELAEMASNNGLRNALGPVQFKQVALEIKEEILPYL